MNTMARIFCNAPHVGDYRRLVRVAHQLSG